MKLRSMCVAALVAGVGVSSAQAEVVTRVCVMTGSQETPAVATAAMGCGRFVIDTCANTVSFRIVHWGLSAAEIAAHIHGPAAPGVPAGVVFPLPAGTLKTGVWNYPEAMESAILGGNLYVNVHSAAFGGGEIRGQIVTHVAVLDGLQEVPANASGGAGVGLFMLDRGAKTLSYYIMYGGLGTAEIAAHIHGYQPHTVAAGVVFPLPAANPKVGVWAYPVANEQAIIDGLCYVNIHTVGFGGGEIRGQIVSSVNPMDGTQEVPVNASATTGMTLISLDRTGNRLGIDVARGAFATGETASHIHGYSPPGVASGVKFALPLGARKLALWAFGAADLVGILANNSYSNDHTAAFGGGEIRGQVNMPILPVPVVCHGACVADFDDGSGTGVPDGGVTIDDLLYYLNIFDAGMACADVDDGTFSGTLDCGVTIDDLLYYLFRFDSGC